MTNVNRLLLKLGQQRLEQRRHAAEFVAMRGGQFFQHGFAFLRQRERHAPSILGIGMPDDITAEHQTIHQSHRAVVPDGEALREIAHGGRAIAMPLDRQKRLVLLGGKPDFSGFFFAEHKELPQQKAEFRQKPVIGRFELPVGRGFSWTHGCSPQFLTALHYIVTRHKPAPV